LYKYAKDGIEALSQETSFTIEELRTLADGKTLPIESRQKLTELSEDIQKAHQKERRKAVETLCAELRAGGFNGAEKARFTALLSKSEPGSEYKDAIASMRRLQESILKT
jgi:hypothetical protein